MVSEVSKITPTRPLVLVESLTPLGPFEEKQNVRPSRFPCGFGNQAAQSWGEEEVGGMAREVVNERDKQQLEEKVGKWKQVIDKIDKPGKRTSTTNWGWISVFLWRIPLRKSFWWLGYPTLRPWALVLQSYRFFLPSWAILNIISKEWSKIGNKNRHQLQRNVTNNLESRYIVGVACNSSVETNSIDFWIVTSMTRATRAAGKAMETQPTQVMDQLIITEEGEEAPKLDATCSVSCDVMWIIWDTQLGFWK